MLFGLYSLVEGWEKRTGLKAYALSAPLLCDELPDADSYLCIDATVMPGDDCIAQMLQLGIGQSLTDSAGLIGFHVSSKPVYQQIPIFSEEISFASTPVRCTHPMDLVVQNATEIVAQYNRPFASTASLQLSSTNHILGNQLFVGPNVQMECCFINSTEGPVIIGANTLIMEGTCIRGPVVIGADCVIKMGTKIYGGTTIGNQCTIGGEIKNSIVSNYSNKAHDGYLGDSYLGEWCNLGAGTSNSNVKNNAGEVTMWQQGTQSWVLRGNKCGTIMGDYSRTAINTSLNTGTTIGVCSSIHGGSIPPKHVPSFKWGAEGDYELNKALADIANWMAFKKEELTPTQQQVIIQLYHHILG